MLRCALRGVRDEPPEQVLFMQNGDDIHREQKESAVEADGTMVEN
jgi:hypothetical protein